MSQLTAEYGVNSSMEVAQVEPYFIMMSMIMTITMMTTTRIIIDRDELQ